MVQIQDDQVTETDLPELRETFSDHVGMTTFDGQLLRIEFQVTRLDTPKPPDPPTGRRYPVCRLVLTGPAAAALYNALGTMIAAVSQSAPSRAPPTKQ